MSERAASGDGRTLDVYIRFAGLKRCGNHAISNWLVSKFEGPICFRNNAQKYARLDSTQCDQIEGLRSESRIPADLEDEGSKRLFFVSYEDHPVEDVFDMSRVGRYSQIYGHQIQSFFHIVLIRDPYNYFASRLQSELNGDMGHDDRFSDSVGKHVLIHLWKRYAECYLRFCESSAPYEIGISYNRWLTDRDYRQTLCVQLGVEFDDAGFDTITGWGGGSSFTGQKYEDPQEFLARWRRFEDHPVFREIIDYQEIESLSDRIFGKVIG